MGITVSFFRYRLCWRLYDAFIVSLYLKMVQKQFKGIMSNFQRGQIWLVNFDPSFGHEYKKIRPVCREALHASLLKNDEVAYLIDK